MKEKPILFSGSMVRALLDGRKTQTRRIFKINPLYDFPSAIHPDGSGNGFVCWWGDNVPPAEKTVRFYPGDDGIKCPYGKPGDRLWVRETWAKNEVLPIEDREQGDFIYRADLNDRGVSKWSATWKPSIHMPRLASRIALDITGIRVERLQDISEEDCLEEGVELTPFWGEAERGEPATGYPAEKYAFRALWESINGPGSWDLNTWVWVVEFRRVNA